MFKVQRNGIGSKKQENEQRYLFFIRCKGSSLFPNSLYLKIKKNFGLKSQSKNLTQNFTLKNKDKSFFSCKKKTKNRTFKKSKITRRNFFNLVFSIFLFKNSLILENICYTERGKTDTGHFFFYLGHYFKKKKKKSLEKKYNKMFKNILFSKENELDIIENYLNISSSTLILGFFIFSGIFSSNRSSDKVELPETYSSNQIAAYFKLRPEKIVERLFQIIFEIFTSIIGIFGDIVTYPKNKKNNFFSNNENYIDHFILRGFRIYELNYRIAHQIDPILIFNFSKTVRIGNILQITFFSLNQKKKRYRQTKWDANARDLRETIAKLSPAFIKLAQALVTRPDIVSERIAPELQRLQDDMAFFSNEKAFDFIKKELGANPHQIFSEISNEPVAAASLGQVYKANLDGIQVAVKVQRPGLSEIIALDILIIRFLASLLQKIFKIRTDLVAIIDEYAQRLFEELDYRKESSNMIKFRSLYGYMDMIYIPRVFVEYSSKHVLVMEWVEGERLVKDSTKSMPEEVSLIEIGVRCSLVQLLETGFLHCDPHGGNLIKTKDGRLAYLDYGLVSEIPETVRFSFISAILNLINREYESLARDFNGMALIRSDDLDKELSKISFAFFETFDKPLSNFDKFTFQNITEKILRLTVKFPFILPPYFLNNLRAIATLEGLALMADPNFKIANVVYPYIINKLLTNPAPQFQGALEDFLIDIKTVKPNWNRLEALLQDPEWTETFSDQSENLSDTVLNFIISPTGNFLKNLILQNLVEFFLEKVIFFFYWVRYKSTVFFRKNLKYGNEKKFDGNIYTNVLRKDMKGMIFPNFNGSKIYDWNNVFLLIHTCVFFTLIFISEFIFKSFIFTLNFIQKKFRSILYFSSYEKFLVKK